MTFNIASICIRLKRKEIIYDNFIIIDLGKGLGTANWFRIKLILVIRFIMLIIMINYIINHFQSNWWVLRMHISISLCM